ncbi:hypothetical protein GCM10027451_17910 [Geodermatophilus aquaeductus]|nr:hypothetical protein [Geodermatophilus aquaeductus]
MEAREQVVVGLLLSVAGSLLGTWVGKSVYGSPELNLLAAILGALVPAMLPQVLPKGRSRPLIVVVVVVVAVLVTYTTVTTANFAESSAATFPIPPGVSAPDAGAPGIEVTPDPVVCAGVGSCGLVIIRSTGSEALRVDAIEFADPGEERFSFDDRCADQTLVPAAECSFEVMLTAADPEGAGVAELLINQNLPGGPTSVTLRGEVPAGPGIVVTPNPVVCAGLGSCGSVTIRSTGFEALRVDAIEFADPGEERFSFDDRCANQTLAPAATSAPAAECSFEVTYERAGPQGSAETELLINQNLPGGPTSVTLRGEVPAGPGIVVTPNPVVCAGLGSCGSVTIRSTGFEALRVDAIEFADPGEERFSFDDRCANQTLAPAATSAPAAECSFEVTYERAGPQGSAETELLINQNLPGGPTRVVLRGSA